MKCWLYPTIMEADEQGSGCERSHVATSRLPPPPQPDPPPQPGAKRTASWTPLGSLAARNAWTAFWPFSSAPP